jgi:hypothetical protein
MVIRSVGTLLIQSGTNAAAIKTQSTNVISIPSLESVTSFKYKTTELETTLAGKENTLTFSSPLSRATNTISLDSSTYLTNATASTTYEPI